MESHEERLHRMITCTLLLSPAQLLHSPAL